MSRDVAYFPANQIHGVVLKYPVWTEKIHDAWVNKLNLVGKSPVITWSFGRWGVRYQNPTCFSRSAISVKSAPINISLISFRHPRNRLSWEWGKNDDAPSGHRASCSNDSAIHLARVVWHMFQDKKEYWTNWVDTNLRQSRSSYNRMWCRLLHLHTGQGSDKSNVHAWRYFRALAGLHFRSSSKRLSHMLMGMLGGAREEQDTEMALWYLLGLSPSCWCSRGQHVWHV